MRIEKNMQYNPYLWSNRRNFRALQEIGVETMVNINDRKFFVLLEQGWTAVLSAVNRPTVVTWTLNDNVGHSGFSYGADTTLIPQNVFLCIIIVVIVLFSDV